MISIPISMIRAVLRFDDPEDGRDFLTWAVEIGLQARDLTTPEAPFPRYRLIEIQGDELESKIEIESWFAFVVSLGVV